MSYYRNTYLKSEDWKSLRSARLSKSSDCCMICGKINVTFDIHHVNYRNLFDVEVGDLRVVCCATKYGAEVPVAYSNTIYNSTIEGIQDQQLKRAEDSRAAEKSILELRAKIRTE